MTKASARSNVVRAVLPTETIVPDPENRSIVEDEDFEALCDSMRLLGLLQPVHVWRQANGSHRLIDGERRWRAARKIGLGELACEVWSDEDQRRVAVAGLVLNEHRRAHGCLQVARRLRDIKNQNGFSHVEVAAHTGLPLDRVKTYFALFAASDEMLHFFEEHEVPMKVAAELVRYEKATNEGRARQLLTRHAKEPLAAQEIAALRKRDAGGKAKGREPREDGAATSRTGLDRVLDRLEVELKRDPEPALAALHAVVARLGYGLVAIETEAA